MKILDLGCGENKIKGAIGLDNVNLKSVDIVHDLIHFPYPFESKSIDIGIYAFLNFSKKWERSKLLRKIGVDNIILTGIMFIFSLFGAVFGMKIVAETASTGKAKQNRNHPLRTSRPLQKYNFNSVFAIPD